MVGHRPGYGGHGGHEHGPMRPNRFDHPACHRALGCRHRLLNGPAQEGKLRHQLVQQPLERSRRLAVRRGHFRWLAPALQDDVDRSMLQVQAAAVLEEPGLRPGHGC